MLGTDFAYITSPSKLNYDEAAYYCDTAHFAELPIITTKQEADHLALYYQVELNSEF